MRKLILKKKSISGATVVEIIIYTFLLFSLLFILTEIFASILDAQKNTTAYSALESDSRYILQKFIYEISNSTSIDVPLIIGDSGYTLTITRDGINNSFFLSNSNLILSRAGQNMELNSYLTNVESLTVTKLGNPSGSQLVNISLSMSSKIQETSGVQNNTYQITVGLR